LSGNDETAAEPPGEEISGTDETAAGPRGEEISGTHETAAEPRGEEITGTHETAVGPRGEEPRGEGERRAGESSSAQRMKERLAERREAHARRGRIYRIGFAIAGATVTLAGLTMLVTPGPAFVVIPIGLAMLALEFAWAERLLDRALDQAEIAARKAAETTTAQRILGGVAAVLAIGAAFTAWLLWEIPLIPG
jgi:uncharacterized protein (TIGR02611 family)